ncbi:hypothetical protein HG536_0C06080 [Torulaspora globosa]|uniref:ENTH domain-containing protein n=1 Tax=Torulaspora globosa TaxID=48254 RepID=A0A7G3ZG03_9SACH|nr:uncharacterized protein HG536_0C06080 [Torulaspora globosa]QLL32439.1 hypothetical protein HG536_0C06080 [Torulaspora globosa]
MSLEDTLANMSLYDAKKYFRRAQNVVFNYTEMEAKVREATNNEPWGASTTLMEQISQGTYNMREREEILGMIFRRFTEKRGSEWRQIYKALQLLDYLIRHGSERFIDDTRSSISLVRMLESFHYIDSQGRDQGVNVRNRAKALAELLSDDEKIRSERKKARETAKKYKGVAGGSVTGNENLNPRAGFNSTRVHGISISAESDDEEEEFTSVGQQTKHSSSNSVDLLGSDDSKAAPLKNNSNEDGDDEEFTDFQSAAPSAQAITGSQNGHSQKLPAVSAPPTIVAAIAADSKKSDPFSSLFSSAMKASESASRVPAFNAAKTSQKRNVAESKNDHDDDDDDNSFGEMMGAGAAEQHEDAQAKAGEVDLLSF